MDHKPPPEGVSYSYGHRLRGFIYGDPIEAVIRRLEDPPCITMIQFLIHGEYLDVYAYIRSNDMFKAWPYTCTPWLISQAMSRRDLLNA